MAEQLPRAKNRPGAFRHSAARTMPPIDLTEIETISEEQREEIAGSGMRQLPEPSDATKRTVDETRKRILAAKLAKMKASNPDDDDDEQRS